MKVTTLSPAAVDASVNQVDVSYQLIDKASREGQSSTDSGEEGAAIDAALIFHVNHNVQGVAYPVLVTPTWASSYDYVVDPKDWRCV